MNSRIVLPIALAAMLCGCAGEHVPELGEGVFIPMTTTDSDDLSTAERTRVEDSLREIEILRVRGSYEQALEIVENLLRRNLPRDLDAKCLGLRLEIRQGIHANRPVHGRLLADRDLYAFGDEIVLTLELRNLSGRDVEIPLASGEASEGFLLLKLTREETDIHGNVRQVTEQGRLALPGKVVIPPHESYRAHRALPTSAREHDGLTVFRISGRIQPSVVKTGDREDFRSIPLLDVVVKILPRNFESLTEDPLGSLRRSLEVRAALHLLISAELVPAADREEATAVLITALRSGVGGLTMPVLASLRRLTGKNLPPERGAWLVWWDTTGRPGG